jgi:hypothetical protein
MQSAHSGKTLVDSMVAKEDSSSKDYNLEFE